MEPTEAALMHGFADIVRSRGLASLQGSEALKNVEAARGTFIDSRLKATENYYDLKRMNAEHQSSQRSEPLSFEGYVRLARAQAPVRLSVSELDPFTGAIKWPASLRESVFAKDRRDIQVLYIERAENRASNKREIQEACDRLMLALKAEIAAFVQADYITAVRFVEALRYEAVVARN